MIALSLRTPRVSPIGVDIGARSICAAQFRRGRAGMTLLGAVRLHRPAVESPGPKAPKNAGPIDHPLTTAEAERLAGVLARQGFMGREVVISVPDARMLSASLELPPKSSGAPLGQLAVTELARLNRREPGALESSWWEVPAPLKAGATDATHAMVAGCETQEVLRLADLLESVGLQVIGVDSRFWALARSADHAARASRGSAATMTVAADVGESSVLLTVYRSGRLETASIEGAPPALGQQVVYERCASDLSLAAVRGQLRQAAGLDEVAMRLLFEAGLDAASPWADLVTADVHVALDDYAQWLADEIGQAVAYSAHRYAAPLAQIALTGEAMEVGGLASAVTSRLGDCGSLVRVVGPASLVDVPAETIPSWATDHGLTTACGLALYPREVAA